MGRVLRLETWIMFAELVRCMVPDRVLFLRIAIIGCVFGKISMLG
jgi:hypothetical protein